MVTLFPVTLNLYPDEYAALGQYCQHFASVMLNGYPAPKHMPMDYMLLADLYGRLFTYSRTEAWRKRRHDKRYTLRLSIFYVRLLHKSLQGHTITEPQQRVLSQLDQLLK
ncbi:hypothetical protein FAES_3655 [Fibrella aestuarina BUZ 2]|uniref:Uncharacterized protein n=1 Tax=Fibrella aestuarina BUZ 2 TaxID=1166018 RepID=I0KC09_9BACT|nr:hypothetical protein [Fibrella aestuarina]CCH01662.1 hypothetical protein FAES_3655 [Fibrella aestuarina BUZ 2]